MGALAPRERPQARFPVQDLGTGLRNLLIGSRGSLPLAARVIAPAATITQHQPRICLPVFGHISRKLMY